MSDPATRQRLLAVVAEAGEPDHHLAAERLELARDQAVHSWPFHCLGHDSGSFFYLPPESGQIISITAGAHTKLHLLQLAPLEWWKTNYRQGKGLDWDAAANGCMSACFRAGVFNRDRIRGRGVHLDEGRVVWHLGDRLEVDGQLQPLIGFKSRFIYEAKSAFEIDVDCEALTDEEGCRILEIIQAMGWQSKDDPLHLTGLIVLSNVCGALPVRPQCQLSSPFGTGKSDTLERVIRPLQGSLSTVNIGSSEAGIRQANGSDVLPILIDESEQADGESRLRDGHLRMARYSFDGQKQLKGTPGHRQVEFLLRSTIFLSGINSELPNPADRSRFVVAQRKPLSPAEWHKLQLRRSEFITPQAGQRLIRRTVDNLGVLLQNAKQLQMAINASLKPASGRSAELYGLVLAGTHLLTSTERLNLVSASRWLSSIGWPHQHDLIGGEHPADQESRQCLDHILSFDVRWSGGTSTIHELLAIVHFNRQPEQAYEAEHALGRLGIKHHSDGNESFVLIANSGAAVDKVFAKTKWRNGAHVKRLKEINSPHKPVPHGSAWFREVGTHRALRIPTQLLDLSDPVR